MSFMTTIFLMQFLGELAYLFMGGLLGAALALILYFRKIKVNILPALDATAPAILIGYSLGRLGCHFSGDGDWGIKSGTQPTWWFFPDWMWGFRFPHNVANRGVWIENCTFEYCRILEQPVFPTSLYEAMICVLLCLLILLARKISSIVSGVIFSLYLILSGLERFVIEFIRVNTKHDFFGVYLSQAQFISLLLIILGFALLIHRISSTLK